MVKNKFLLLFLLLAIFTKARAQNNNVELAFTPLYNNMPIILSETTFNTHDSFNTNIEVLKFYISNIRFIKDKKILAQDTCAYLIDASKVNSTIIIKKNVLAHDAIQFDLGIDSITNVSGALGGDLDPTKGMYWTWQSGYINFKLEGHSNASANAKKEFTFHLGGYTSPFNCLKTIQLNCSNDHINIGIDIARFLAKIDLQTTSQIMSPTSQAVQLSEILTKLFYILP